MVTRPQRVLELISCLFFTWNIINWSSLTPNLTLARWCRTKLQEYRLLNINILTYITSTVLRCLTSCFVPTETDSADPLSSLQFVTDSVFLAGCCNGNVYIADIRTSAAPQLSPPPASSGESVLWWTDASTGPSSCRIVRLSSSGQMVISDLRNPGGAVSRAQLDVQTRCCNLDDVRVSWAPALDDCIAVSG